MAYNPKTYIQKKDKVYRIMNNSIDEGKNEGIIDYGIDEYTKSLLHFDGSVVKDEISGNTWVTLGKTVTTDSYTKVLLHFNESTTKDECGNTWTVYGSPTISTTNAKFGSCLQLPGGNTYIALNNGITLGGANFTVDFWCYYGSGSTYNRLFSMTNGSNSGIIEYSYNELSVNRSSNNTAATGVLQHVAIVYEHSNSWVKYYENGVLKSTRSGVTFSSSAWKLGIGYNFFDNGHAVGGSSYNGCVGQVDEFRVSAGIARWTADFTPPTSAYSYTSTSNNYPSYTTTNKKFGQAMNNSKGYISTSNTITLGGADFTVDFWGYMNSSSLSYAPFFEMKVNTNTSNNQGRITLQRYGTNNYLSLLIYNNSSSVLVNNRQMTSINPIGTLRHYAIVYDYKMQTLYFYVDGILIDTITSLNIERLNRYISVGGCRYYSETDQRFIGQIDEFRISDGMQRYTKNFIPPEYRYGEGVDCPIIINLPTNDISTLYDNLNFEINTDKTYIQSSCNSYYINSGASYGYIKFKSNKSATLLIDIGVSSEGGYDVGCITVGNAEYKPTNSQARNKTAVEGQSYVAVISGTVSRTTYIYVVEANKEYYINFSYTKDGSVHGGEDRFKIYSINYDNTTKALLHFDESTTKDICGNTWSVSGSPTISSTYSKFGGNSLYLNGSSYIYNTNLSSIINSSNWTIDFWALVPDTNKKYFFGTWNSKISTTSSTTNAWIALDISQSTTGVLALVLYSNDTSGSTALSVNTWYHIAVTYNGTDIQVYLNGSLQITKTISNIQMGGTFRIGSNPSGSELFTGYIDEFRVSNIVRWSANFSVPTLPY